MQTLIKFTVESFRRLPSPYDEQGRKMYTAVVSVKNIPIEIDEWRELNVRDPMENKSVPKEIAQSLAEEPEEFFFKNRGLLILADRVEFDNVTNNLELIFSDKKMNGLADGGHTFRVIQRHLSSLSEEQLKLLNAYVKLEILEGFKTREEVVPIIVARNNSTAVAEQSFQELLGAYESIKKVLSGQPYFNRVYYKQYEELPDGTAKDIDIKEILSYLICFDVENFDRKNHPIKAYSGKSSVVGHFASHENLLTRMAPMLPKILELRDLIYEGLPEAYRGSFGKLTDVITIKQGMKKEELCFVGRTSNYRIPDGFIYPILNSFRVCVAKKNGHYQFGKDPVTLWSTLREELADAVVEQAKRIKNPNQLGKDVGTWTICYKTTENEILRSSS
jgi:hypothetical protein